MTTDGNEGSQLDPELWKELPAELIEKVIAKLPFSRVIAFRTVCKHWHSVVIPRAAAQLEATSGCALLCFSYHNPSRGWLLRDTESRDHAREFQGFAWWLQICNVKSELSGGTVRDFRPKSFPAPREGEIVQLLICERGLLFFGFIRNDDQLVRDVVVCNPLTSQSKSLALAHQLGPASFHYMDLLVGVSFNSTTGSYCFVCAGVERTYLYDSNTSAWTNSAVLLPTVKEVVNGATGLCPKYPRSVCCNGNLFWYTSIFRDDGKFTFWRDYVLKFDIQNATWTLIPDLFKNCDDRMECSSDVIASYNGDVLIWHLHDELIGFGDSDRPFKLVSCELFDEDFDKADLDSDDDEGVPQYIDWPCRYNQNLVLPSGNKLMRMPRDIMERVYQFLVSNGDPCMTCVYYSGFSQQSFIYHVLFTSDRDQLFILVHNTYDDSYSEISCDHIDETFRSQAGYLISRDSVWSFWPSLTSLP